MLRGFPMTLEQSPSLRWQLKSTSAQWGYSSNALQGHDQPTRGWREEELNLRRWAGHCERYTVVVRHGLCVVIQTHVAQFSYDLPNNLPLCGGRERVHWLSDELHQILCKITPAWHRGTRRMARGGA